ncbi:MAG TPA: TIM barrel protein [Bryobacteraceae bacterium]|nr:TIM barrel protein [Bryobacteraceae bacterium]
MNRRTAIGALGAAATVVTRVRAQQPGEPAAPDSPRFGLSAPKRTAPMLCAYSRNMARIPYAELGLIAQQIGYEGIDLTVMIGGHVDPRVTNVDLVRAFESIRGAGLEVPMISTAITSALDPTAYPVLYLTGHSQIPLFRMGLWQYRDSGDIRQRLSQCRREMTQIVNLGQRCGITAMIPNRAGEYVGEAVWDSQSILQSIDPRWAGYIFDPAEATAEGGLGGWETALRLALPRLKALSLQDFYWTRAGGDWQMTKCPLGDGMVDWQRFFRIVSEARFTGPISIAMEYKPKDEPGAMSKDLDFARKQIQRAWGQTS